MGKSFESVLPTGGRYIDGDERAEYENRPLRLIAAKNEPKAQFGPRWVVDAAVMDTGEMIAIALSSNPTRDTMFAEVADDLAKIGYDAYEPVCLVLQQPSGGGFAFWTFRSATADEIEAATAAGALAAESTDTDSDGDGEDEAAAPTKAKGK